MPTPAEKPIPMPPPKNPKVRPSALTGAGSGAGAAREQHIRHKTTIDLIYNRITHVKLFIFFCKISSTYNTLHDGSNCSHTLGFLLLLSKFLFQLTTIPLFYSNLYGAKSEEMKRDREPHTSTTAILFFWLKGELSKNPGRAKSQQSNGIE